MHEAVTTCPITKVARPASLTNHPDHSCFTNTWYTPLLPANSTFSLTQWRILLFWMISRFRSPIYLIANKLQQKCMIISSVLVAQAFEGVFLIFAHQDATTTDSRKLLFEDVGTLSFLFATSHCFSCAAHCAFLQGKGMRG